MKKINLFLSLSAMVICSGAFAQENIIEENGNVGLGTTAPTARLTVAGSTRIDSTLTVNDSVVMATSARVGEDLKVEGNLYIPNIPSLEHYTNESFLVKDINGLVQGITTQGMASTIYSLSCDLAGVNPFWNNGPNKLYTECAGVRVGIGTNSPEFTFDCRGDAKTAGHLWANQSLSIGANMNAFSKLNIVNTNRAAVIQANTVGNTKPYQRLMYFEYDNTDTKILEVQNPTAGYTAFSLNSNGEMDIHNGVVPIFHLGTNGMLSLRNNSMETFRVEANGMVRARKIKVDSETWADYVFDENYKLLPLNELELFVKQNKHLPSIPSEQQIKEEGIDVTEMNVKMMEKIEELTLYLIQQNKEIEKLKAEIQRMQQN
ncbi:hypothetical protein [uncultured Fluviicola sp.]|uniref:hypothetical protein n=1 Tax=uncultured Fluviicola sp. TaxID=463303 RepID=UPI0025E05CBD|nr:hypothetical protein [uncultured Fluviicola sp.]